MTVHITALDLAGLDDLGVSLWKRIVSDVATGGAAELYWNKKSRRAITKGVKKIGKAAGKVLCPAAEAFTGKSGAKTAAMSTGYGAAAVVAASAAKGLCSKGKKPAVAAAVIAEQHWYDNPWAVGGVAVAAGALLGALFARGR